MLRQCSFSLVLLIIIGCSDAKPKQVPVTGTVTLDGKPLIGAQISFIPTGTAPGTVADGRTGTDGSYSLMARRTATPGVVAGEYKVTISKRLNPDGSEPDPNVPPIESQARELLPLTYSDLDQTTLTATVSEGGGKHDFPLTGARKKRS